ncbi:MAG: hypothetical protein ABI476_07470 [Oxalobacteraceae bacterium]
MSTFKRLLPGGAAALLLALIFGAYLRPDFVLDLAGRIYLCF